MVEARKVVKRAKFGEAVFQALAARGQVRNTTDLRRLRYELRDDYKVDVENEEFNAFFKELANLGFGKFIKGTGQNPNRFVWRGDSKETAIEVLGVQKAVEAVVKKGPTGRGLVESNTLKVPYKIRGATYWYEIPDDITTKEANELGEFLKKFGR